MQEKKKMDIYATVRTPASIYSDSFFKYGLKSGEELENCDVKNENRCPKLSNCSTRFGSSKR